MATATKVFALKPRKADEKRDERYPMLEGGLAVTTLADTRTHRSTEWATFTIAP